MVPPLIPFEYLLIIFESSYFQQFNSRMKDRQTLLSIGKKELALKKRESICQEGL